MTDDNSNKPVDIDTDDLDAFEKEYFVKDTSEEEVVEEEVSDEDDQEVDDHAEDDDDPLAPEDDEEEEDEPEVEEPKGKKNRKSAQERINELTAKTREAERREQVLLKRLEEIEASVKKEVKEEAPKGLREQLPADAPHPDTKGEDGEPLYELGEFDPKFIRDLTKFTIEQEMKTAKEKTEQEAQAKAIETSRQELADAWIEKLDKAEEEMPEIREDIKDLTDTFQDIEPVYGEYLASTIMSSEFGPQIMHYLSQNIGEAQRIVASGPAAATLAIGRLEARFVISTEQEEKKSNKKVSAALEPPETTTRGRGGRFTISPDTDDLDAFEKEYFKKR